MHDLRSAISASRWCPRLASRWPGRCAGGRGSRSTSNHLSLKNVRIQYVWQRNFFLSPNLSKNRGPNTQENKRRAGWLCVSGPGAASPPPRGKWCFSLFGLRIFDQNYLVIWSPHAGTPFCAVEAPGPGHVAIPPSPKTARAGPGHAGGIQRGGVLQGWRRGRWMATPRAATPKSLSGPVTKGCTAGRRWGPAAPAPGVSVAPGCSPGRLPFWLRAGKILAPKRSPACGFRDILGMLKADTEHADGRQHRRKAPGAAGFLAQGVFHASKLCNQRVLHLADLAVHERAVPAPEV